MLNDVMRRRVPALAAAALFAGSAALIISTPADAGRYYPVWADTNVLRVDQGNPGTNHVAVVAVTIDPAGDVIAVTGDVTDNFSNSGVAQVMKYSAAGSRLWVADLTGGSSSTGGDVVTDPAGNVYVGGYLTGAGSSGPAVWKFSSNGALAWTRSITAGSGVPFKAITYDSGEIFAGGSNIVMIDVGTGALSWNYSTPNSGIVHGILATSTTLFISYQQYLGTGTVEAQSTISIGAPSWTVASAGGGRLRMGPDGMLYAADYVSPNNTGFSSMNAGIVEINPATGANLGTGQLLLDNHDVNQGGCCANGFPTDFGFLPDGSIIASWCGSGNGGGAAEGHTGVAGFQRTLVNCGGGTCDWSPLWYQTRFDPYFTDNLIDIRSIAVGGVKAFMGTGPIYDGTTGTSTHEGLAGLDNVLATNAPDKETLQIRRNVIRIDQHGTALIVMRGAVGATVRLSVFGLGGNLVHTLNACPGCTGDSKDYQLDANGELQVSYDGTYDGTTYLKQGMYFMVVSGAFNDRKPFVIKGEVK